MKTSLVALVCLSMLCAIAAAAEGVPAQLPGAPKFAPALRAELSQALAAQGPSYEARTRNKHADGSPIFSNRLLLEASPYLQQHAHNPVNWHPWGDEAFETAKKLDRPVLVSIGYSTCHWCHVMEEESFDDPETAELLNSLFIAIKVDRETRPDIDAIYMSAIHAMGQNGGWPLNVFLTPDRKPFYAGTYFPPEDGRGRPGFPRTLKSISRNYHDHRERTLGVADRVSEAIRKDLEAAVAETSSAPNAASLERARRDYERRFDRKNGGIGQRTKFPSSLPVRLLLRHYRRSGDEAALEMATLTLEKMAGGGIRDHVGGGFHRYSTERTWLVPHFEKMLYDNALLVLAFLEAAQLTGRSDFEQVARETLDYMAREMTAPGGGFYSATDADSAAPNGEMEEGLFFTWSAAEIDAALNAKLAKALRAYYAVSDRGNFEGRNILHTPRPLPEVAASLSIPVDVLQEQLEQARAKLYDVRAERVPPLRDDKVLTAWNGLMISAFARAGFALDEPRYREAAARAARYVLAEMRGDDRLKRVSKGGQTVGPAFLEDYAFLIAGLLDLYEADHDTRWLAAAVDVQTEQDRYYADESGGGYFKTASDHEKLLAREKPARDGAVPAGNSIAALNLLRLAELTGRPEFRARASLLLSAFQKILRDSPTALSEMLLAVDYDLDAPKEIAIVTPKGNPDGAGALLAVVRKTFLPNRILAVTGEETLAAHAELVPLLAHKRPLGGKSTAYVCENRVCDRPTSDPAILAEQLAKVRPLNTRKDSR